MNDFGKGNVSINNGGVDSSFHSYSNSAGDATRQDWNDVETAKPEELQPLKDPCDKNYKHVNMDSKSSQDLKQMGINNNDPGQAKKVEKTCEDFEEILELVGSKGKFQKILLYAILCPIVTVSPFLLLNTVFLWVREESWQAWRKPTTDAREDSGYRSAVDFLHTAVLAEMGNPGLIITIHNPGYLQLV